MFNSNINISKRFRVMDKVRHQGQKDAKDDCEGGVILFGEDERKDLSPSESTLDGRRNDCWWCGTITLECPLECPLECTHSN